LGPYHMKSALSFDDVLLVPKRSLPSRSDVDLQVSLGLEHRLSLPIISANMSTVTEDEMAIEMRRCGGVGAIHRMCSPERQVEIVNATRAGYLNMGMMNAPYIVSIENGMKGVERAQFVTKKAYHHHFIFCLDVAHAFSQETVDTLKELYFALGDQTVIVGNIATPGAADFIMQEINKVNDIGLEIIFKVGIGGGSQCTTRVVTGCGLPTFESILRFRDHSTKYTIIADGGIKNSGDIVKALAAGANFVMLGSLLAGTKEAPGPVIKGKGKRYKVYRGSASFGGQEDYSHKEGDVEYVEGEESLVPYKGDVGKILTTLKQGIRSGFSYCNAHNLTELRQNAEFVTISSSGYLENLPHGSY
jgi:IMP dehydrogenase